MNLLLLHCGSIIVLYYYSHDTVSKTQSVFFLVQLWNFKVAVLEVDISYRAYTGFDRLSIKETAQGRYEIFREYTIYQIVYLPTLPGSTVPLSKRDFGYLIKKCSKESQKCSIESKNCSIESQVDISISVYKVIMAKTSDQYANQLQCSFACYVCLIGSV